MANNFLAANCIPDYPIIRYAMVIICAIRIYDIKSVNVVLQSYADN